MTFLKEKVSEYLKRKATLIVSEIDENSPLVQIGSLDSLQLIELVMWLEKETGAPVIIEELLVDNDVSVNSIVS